MIFSFSILEKLTGHDFTHMSVNSGRKKQEFRNGKAKEKAVSSGTEKRNLLAQREKSSDLRNGKAICLICKREERAFVLSAEEKSGRFRAETALYYPLKGKAVSLENETQVVSFATQLAALKAK